MVDQTQQWPRDGAPLPGQFAHEREPVDQLGGRVVDQQ